MNSRDVVRMGWRVAFGLLLLSLSITASAIGKVDPGDEPALEADEGLLLVSIDSDVGLASVRFGRHGSSVGTGFLKDIPAGRTSQLYRLPAGRYQWTTVVLVDRWSWVGGFNLADEAEFGFEVKAGRVNYAGDLVYRSSGSVRAQMRLSNRALLALDWMQAEHPVLGTKLPFLYSGYYPDPFPAFYDEARRNARHLPANLDAGRAAPQPGTLPLPPGTLWKDAYLEDVALSPDGHWIVEAMREKPDLWALGIFNAEKGTGQRITTSRVPFEDVRWESDRTLLATTRSTEGPRLRAFHFAESTEGKLTVTTVEGPVGGEVVDMLPAEPGVVLYQRRDNSGQLVVHRLDLNSEDAAKLFNRLRSRDRLNLGVTDDLRWFADGSGRLRAALARKGEHDVVLMHGQGGVYREILSYHASAGFQPLRLSHSGDLFYGLSDEGRGQRELVEFDPVRGRVARTLYSKPGVDLVSAIFDDRRIPIGATYYQDGLLVTDYFDEAGRNLEKMLHAAFPGKTVTTTQRSRDASQMLVWVDGSDQPPQLYLLDTVKRSAQLFDELAPDLAGRKFVPAQVLRVRAGDGLPIEAFLTLPTGEGKRPLVVMVHGGPIGISDDLHFNREVQFLASLGYAVLQVNYRGSDGYGKAFLEAGYRNYGKLIEDDIDAAIRSALASYPLDESRMCAVGTSYGGYSAMVAAIRWPQRFRCVVSIAGISDLGLFFTASDGGRDSRVRQAMERIIGNPGNAEDLAGMQATSPVYRYQELKVPVMLVHGGQDARVDMEHTRRLVRLLNLADRQPVVMVFPDEGHGLQKLGNVRQAWTSIAGFLGEYLGKSTSAGTAAAATSANLSPAK